MFAVVRTGGKQYTVAQKDRLEVPKIDAKEGASIDLEVLMTSDGKGASMGEKGAKVSAKVIEHTRADKIVVFKKKRRKGYKRTRGHRQGQTILRVLDINGKGAVKRTLTKKSTAPDDKKTEKVATKTSEAAEAPKQKSAPVKKKASTKKKAASKKKAVTKKKSGSKKKAAAKKSTTKK